MCLFFLYRLPFFCVDCCLGWRVANTLISVKGDKHIVLPQSLHVGMLWTRLGVSGGGFTLNTGPPRGFRSEFFVWGALAGSRQSNSNPHVHLDSSLPFLILALALTLIAIFALTFTRSMPISRCGQWGSQKQVVRSPLSQQACPRRPALPHSHRQKKKKECPHTQSIVHSSPL